MGGTTLASGATVAIKNNIIGVTPTQASGIYVFGPATITGTFACDYNLYWNCSYATPFYSGGSGHTFAAWQGLGYDVHGLNNTDPWFINAGGSYGFVTDFKLQPFSPAVNTGVNVGLTADYLGNPIVGLPDIGALEYNGAGITLPIVTTSAPQLYLGLYRLLGGSVVSNGGDVNMVAGICFGTSPHPDINGLPGTVIPAYFPGNQPNPFVVTFSGGDPTTTYYYRMYGTNSAGTTYGAEYSFTISTPIIHIIVANGHVIESGGHTIKVTQ